MNKTSQVMKDVAPYLSLGLQLTSTIVLCGLCGYWFDKQYVSSPWGVAISLTFGAIAGLTHFIRSVLHISKRPTNKNTA